VKDRQKIYCLSFVQTSTTLEFECNSAGPQKPRTKLRSDQMNNNDERKYLLEEYSTSKEKGDIYSSITHNSKGGQIKKI